MKHPDDATPTTDPINLDPISRALQKPLTSCFQLSITVQHLTFQYFTLSHFTLHHTTSHFTNSGHTSSGFQMRDEMPSASSASTSASTTMNSIA